MPNSKKKNSSSLMTSPNCATSYKPTGASSTSTASPPTKSKTKKTITSSTPSASSSPNSLTPPPPTASARPAPSDWDVTAASKNITMPNKNKKNLRAASTSQTSDF